MMRIGDKCTEAFIVTYAIFSVLAGITTTIIFIEDVQDPQLFGTSHIQILIYYMARIICYIVGAVFACYGVANQNPKAVLGFIITSMVNSV